MSRVFLLLKTMRYAIKAEAYCQERRITCQVLPVPRHISSECGMCLEVEPDKAKHALAQLQQAGFQVTLAQI